MDVNHYWEKGVIMYILGIASKKHDSAACLLEDGKILAAIEEERLSRIKHDGSFPMRSINTCLKIAGIKLTDVDYIAYFWNYEIIKRKLWRDQPFFNRCIKTPWRYLFMIPHLNRDEKEIETFAEKANAKVYFIPHHLAHAASAYLCSQFKRANILTLDARGEITSGLMGTGEGSEIDVISEIPLPHSIGILYSAITEFLGFKPHNDEWKVMGLQAYGKNIYNGAFDKIVKLTDDGFKINLNYLWGYIGTEWKHIYTPDLIKLFGVKPRENEYPINGIYEHIAASLQKKTEEVFFHLYDLLHEVTGYKDLCLAGGVCLNSVANGKLYLNKGLSGEYIQPAAYDAGAALGAACYLYNLLTGKRPEFVKHVYLGCEFSNERIEDLLKIFKIRYEHMDDICGFTAEKLAEGNIVGWFQGKVEWGPRALGNRSILANPSLSEMKEKVNNSVKHREMWRPFAASIMKEDYHKYVKGCDSPFMTLTFPVIEDKRYEIIAATHIDGTTRPQTVEREVNQKWWSLLKKFKEITGIPAILNTSFNLAGEPIVCTPEDAIKTFFTSGMDYLVLGDYVCMK